MAVFSLIPTKVTGTLESNIHNLGSSEKLLLQTENSYLHWQHFYLILSFLMEDFGYQQKWNKMAEE